MIPALIPILLPFVATALTQIFKKNIPKKLQPLCPLAMGAIAGGAAAAAGMNPVESAQLGTAVGFGSIGIYEAGKMIRDNTGAGKKARKIPPTNPSEKKIIVDAE